MMKRSMIGACVAALLAAPLGGCISFGYIDKRATTINERVGSAQNRALLLNLVRASRMEPLYFLTMSNINGSATEDLKLGLPTVTFGPNKNAVLGRQDYSFGGNATNTLDSNTTTSFQVGVLGSKDFYAGLLIPLGLNDVNLLLNQGFSRELVYYLVIDRVTVTDVTDLPKGADDATAPTNVYYNNPKSGNYAKFQYFIEQAMTHGLVTEPAPYRSPAAADLGHGPVATAIPAADSARAMEGVLNRLAEAIRPPAPQAQAAQLCYDWALATEAAKRDFPDAGSRCGARALSDAASPIPPSKLAVTLGGRTLQIDVRTRSIYGILTYLGRLMADQEQGAGNPAAVRLHDYQLPAESTDSGLLLNVIEGHPADAREGCFAEIGYEGHSYCVPAGPDSNHTKTIFNILNALLALKTSQGDLPVTQTVRITP